MIDRNLVTRLQSLHSVACSVASDAPAGSRWGKALKSSIDAIREAFEEESRAAAKAPEPATPHIQTGTISLGDAVLMLEIQSLIADKSFLATQGNADLVVYERWQADYYAMGRQINARIEEILCELRGETGGEE
jgi:hypothetical protein